MPDLSDLIEDLDEQLANDPDVNDALDVFMVDEVIPVWVRNSPVDSGDYVDSIEVTKKAEGGKGEVGATVDYANIIEWGSIDTPEFAPRTKTESHFNQ